MPRPCTTCGHPDVDDINRALVAGESVPAVASRYSTKRRPLGRMAVQRHKQEHLPATLRRAHDAAAVAHADDLLAQVRMLQSRALGILDRAERTGQLMPARAAIREARGCLELLGKLMGELDTRPQLNLIMLPQWGRLVSGLRDVLAPHPAILAQVSAHLLTLEDDEAARAG